MNAITVGTVTIPWHRSHMGLEGWPLPGGEITQNAGKATLIAAAIDRMSKPVEPLPASRLLEIRAKLVD